MMCASTSDIVEYAVKLSYRELNNIRTDLGLLSVIDLGSLEKLSVRDREIISDTVGGVASSLSFKELNDERWKMGLFDPSVKKSELKNSLINTSRGLWCNLRYVISSVIVWVKGSRDV